MLPCIGGLVEFGVGCVFSMLFRAVDETAVAFELPSWAEIWIQGLYCRSLVEEMRSAKHMRLLCHSPLLYSTKLALSCSFCELD